MTTETALSPVLDVPAQSQATTLLHRSLAAGEIGHAIAFLGPPEVGQDAAARGLAAALNCPVSDLGCGTCHDCRRALRGAHPAYVEFAPTGAVHRVSEVRDEWLPTAFTTAALGAWKVLRIREADRMNEASANAFLKGLEEPPPRTTWILDISDADELPDTILSRCRQVPVRPWGRADLEQLAAELVGDADAPRLARVSLGSPRRLRELVAGREPDGQLSFVHHREILRRLRQDGPGHAVVAARMIEGEVRRRTEGLKVESQAQLAELDELYGDAPPKGVRAQVELAAARRERESRTVVVSTALDNVAVWLRDVLAVVGGADPQALVFADDLTGARGDADALTPASLLRMLDLVEATRDSLELNVQQQLALEALFLQMSALALSP